MPGCSTGEEAYSIAMLLHERLSPERTRPHLQIFASDIDERGLEVGRLGRYPASIAEQVGERRLRRFFVREDGTYRVVAELRESILFSTHDLLRDPPFSKLDLISCRNLLIYMNGALQDRVIPLFQLRASRRGPPVPRLVGERDAGMPGCSPPSTRRSASSAAGPRPARGCRNSRSRPTRRR